jgi:ABC-type lipoprotein release transport system permease subunit
MLFTLAWRNIWRQKRRSLVTGLALVLSIALAMSVVCFNDGFYRDMKRVLIDQRVGHVQVHHPDYPGRRALHDTVGDADSRVAALRQDDTVGEVTVRLRGQMLVAGEKKSEGAELQGVVPALEESFSGVSSMLVEGRFVGDDPAHEVVLGELLADTIEVGLGDSIVVLTQSADGSMGNDLYEVVGLISTGNQAIDRFGGYLHLADLQELLVLEGQVHEITLTAPGGTSEADGLATHLREHLGDDVLVRTWAEVDPQGAEMLGMQSVATYIMLFIFLGGAAFVVLNTMMMVVYERTREIGVLMALGMRPRRIVALITSESLLLSIAAVALGVTCGLLLDWYIIEHGVKLLDGDLEFSGARFSGTVKGAFDASIVVKAACFGVGLSVLAALWPAWRASRLRPVEAMRQD